MQKFLSEDIIRKKYFTVDFIVKPLQFPEGDGYNITG